MYIIHGTQDEIVPFYHGEALFNLLPNASRTVPFWARGAGHNNIEMEMPTAYIKRLHQFIRQCDRVLYPPVKLSAMPNQAFSPHMVAAAQVGAKTSNWAGASAQRSIPTSSYHNGLLAQEQKIMNKQRKQRGTLVMKSHAQSQTMTPAAQNAEWQQQQKQRLMVEQCRQQQLRAYLAQNTPGNRVPHYNRTNSVPIMMSSQQTQQLAQQQQQRASMTGNIYQTE